VSTLAYFKARPDYAMGRAFALAFAVHAVLLAVMFLGVRWQSHPADSVTVELWDPPPPPPPAPVVEAPKPPPKPEPAPEVKKPDIAEKAPPPKPKPKPEAKKDDEVQRSLLREQLAFEQRKLDEQRRKLDEQRRTDDARRKAEAERLAVVGARNRALAQWTDKIRGKIRGNIVLPQDISGNPEAIFDVALLPTGEVLSIRKRKSSGHAGYDEAVERAIHKSSPLPLPDQPNLFQRNLELKFRPFDQ
jgi:colicin import membrane protein